MKRSEMLEKLKQHIKDHSIGGPKARTTFDEQAESLLSLIENNGMLPPYPNGPYNPEDLIAGWEPEDEK